MAIVEFEDAMWTPAVLFVLTRRFNDSTKTDGCVSCAEQSDHCADWFFTWYLKKKSILRSKPLGSNGSRLLRPQAASIKKV